MTKLYIFDGCLDGLLVVEVHEVAPGTIDAHAGGPEADAEPSLVLRIPVKWWHQ